MELLNFIGKNIKDDDVVDFLDWIESEVIYNFDKDHENIPDSYSVSSKSKGIELRFDENKDLEVIFLYTKSNDEFNTFDKKLLEDVKIFNKISEVKKYTVANKINLKEGKSNFPGFRPTRWIKYLSTKTEVHYEFVNKELTLLTIMRHSD